MADKLIQDMDLRYMRAAVKTAMPDIVSILRKSLASDKQGGFSESWEEAYQNIPARLSAASGKETVAQGREDLQVDFMLTVAYDQSVEQSDRVSHSSGTYEVHFVDSGKSWATSKRCQMRRL